MGTKEGVYSLLVARGRDSWWVWDGIALVVCGVIALLAGMLIGIYIGDSQTDTGPDIGTFEIILKNGTVIKGIIEQ